MSALRTPDEWSRIQGVLVLDPDGWREDDKSWAEPISEEEFTKRLATSTVGPWQWEAKA